MDITVGKEKPSLMSEEQKSKQKFMQAWPPTPLYIQPTIRWSWEEQTYFGANSMVYLLLSKLEAHCQKMALIV